MMALAPSILGRRWRTVDRGQPTPPLWSRELSLLAQDDRHPGVLSRPRHEPASVDRAAVLSAGAALRFPAPGRAPGGRRAVRRSVCACGRDTRRAQAAKIHGRFPRCHRHFLPARSDPLAAVGLPVRIPAGDACAFFLGLQKINQNFMQNDFPWIVSPVTDLLPAAAPELHWLGTAAPFIQVAFALGLLTRRFRRISLIVAGAMHVFILAMFGPLGLNWNNIIWPWTAAMAVIDILLFNTKQEFSWRDIVWSGPHPCHAAILVVFIGLPLLSFVNAWYSYLSAALYSGNLTEAQIYTNDRGRVSLPETFKAYLAHTSDDTNVINIQRCAIED